MSLTIPNRFSEGDRPGAAPFNANFDAIATAHNSLETDVDTNTSDITTLETNQVKYGSKAFFAQTTTDTAVSAGDTTAVTLDAEVVDNGSAFNTSTYKYIPALSGTYLLTATVLITASAHASDTATLYICKNASGTTETQYKIGGAATQNNVVLSGTIILTSSNANDEFYVKVAAGASGDGITVSDAIFAGCCLIPT